MNQLHCPTCDFEIKDTWNYCVICGEKLKEIAAEVDNVTLNSEDIINHLKKESTYKR